MEVIEISPSSSEKKKESKVTEISSSSSEKKKESEEEDSPLRPFFCLKKKAQMKDFEELEDCFILDLDESPQPKQGDHDHDDVSIVAEKGGLQRLPASKAPLC